MTVTKNRRQKLAERVANSAQDTPEEAAIAKDLLIIEEAKVGIVQTRLVGIAEDIRLWFGKGIDAQFAIGRLLMEARDLFPADQEFGRWLRAQELPFTYQTAWNLRMAASREPEVREYIALNAGREQPRDIGVTVAFRELNAGPKANPEVIPVTDTTPQDPGYAAMRAARRILVEEDHFAAMHVDDMTKVAQAIKDIAAAYNAEKTKRGI